MSLLCIKEKPKPKAKKEPVVPVPKKEEPPKALKVVSTFNGWTCIKQEEYYNIDLYSFGIGRAYYFRIVDGVKHIACKQHVPIKNIEDFGITGYYEPNEYYDIVYGIDNVTLLECVILSINGISCDEPQNRKATINKQTDIEVTYCITSKGSERPIEKTVTLQEFKRKCSANASMDAAFNAFAVHYPEVYGRIN
jgi:hypothetical protein